MSRKTLFSSSRALVLTAALIPHTGPRLFGQETAKPAKASVIPGIAKVAVEVGGEVRSVTGAHNSKFEEHRDIPKGVILRSFDLRLEDPSRPYRLLLRGFDLTQRDQTAIAGFDRYGRVKLRFIWDQLPNFTARNVTSLLNDLGPNVYRVPNTIRQTFEATPDASLAPIVLNLLASTPSSDLRSQRNTGKFTGRFTPTKNWELRVNFERQIRSGLRRISTGTNNIIATPAGDTFQNLGQEMGERMDHRTTTVGAGASYHRRGWLINFDYSSSFFENKQLGLRWDNPFRLTDASATGPTGGLDRGRFAAGQLALPPDNQVHQLTVSGFVLLPLRSKFSGLFSLGYWRQDEAFLPFTLNTAIVANNLPPGVTPTQLSALPVKSLGGDIRAIDQDYVLTSRAFQALTLTFRYRMYDYDNNTLEIRFPGYASFSESFWRTSIVSDPIDNFPFSFFRQKASGEATWRPSQAVRLQGDYVWESWNRQRREVSRTNEHTVGGRLTLDPTKWVDARVSYHYGDRIPRDYSARYQEFSLARMFDQSRRIRHDLSSSVQFQPSGRWFASLSYQYLGDRYDRNFFGLHNYLQGQLAADVGYSIREGSSLYGSYSVDRIRTDYATVARSGGALPFRLPRVSNTWLRDTRDRVDSISLGWNSTLLKDRLSYDFSYGFALSKTNINTANPIGFDPDARLNAPAFSFPEIKDRFHELRAALQFKLRENLALGLTYIFEPYRLNDFMTDILDPWIPDRLAPENDARRYLFLNARDGNYTGHVASVTLRYTF